MKNYCKTSNLSQIHMSEETGTLRVISSSLISLLIELGPKVVLNMAKWKG